MAASLPLISVVVPTYNRRQFIAATIDSVLKQTYDRLELVIVDDGSTDGTREMVLDKYAGDQRLRYLFQANAERAVARNRGIRESHGEYLAFLDSDDLWRPEKLERQIQTLMHEGAPPCCYCLHEVLTDDGVRCAGAVESPPQGNIFAELLPTCFIGSMTPVVHRSCFARVGTFCEDRRLICFEDWEMWTRLASVFAWVLVPEALAFHRLHAGCTQHAADWTIDELRLALMKRYDLSSQQTDAVRAYADGRRWHWAAGLCCHQPTATLRLLGRLIRGEPSRMTQRNFWGLAARSLWRVMSGERLSNPGNRRTMRRSGDLPS